MAIDYNPDKERHVDHRWIVCNATRRPMDGIEVGGEKLRFSEEGFLAVKDEAKANEIRQRYGTDVTVSRVRNPKPADRGHKYFFGSWPEMPWKRKEKDANDA